MNSQRPRDSSPNNRASLPKLSVRQVVVGTLVVVAVCLAFWFLFRFHQVILILFVAIVISTAIRPLVEWLHRRGLPRPLGIILVYCFLLALVAGFIFVGVPLLLRQATNIVAQLPDLYERLRSSMMNAPTILFWRLGEALPAELPFLASPVPGDGEETSSLAQAWQFVSPIANIILGTVAVFILAFSWTLEAERTKQALLLLLPMEKRPEAREVVNTIEQKVGSFIAGQALLVLVIGVLSLIAYLAIGLPYALALAFVAALMEAIPVVGPFLGAAAAILVAFSVDPTKVIWVIIASLVIQQLENTLLVPRIMNRTVGVHPLVTLLALIALGSFFGIVGALVAIPIAAIIQLLVDRYLLTPDVSLQEGVGGRDRLSVLRYETRELVQDVRKQVRSKNTITSDDSDQIEDSLEAIAADLDSILAQRLAPEVTS